MPRFNSSVKYWDGNTKYADISWFPWGQLWSLQTSCQLGQFGSGQECWAIAALYSSYPRPSIYFNHQLVLAYSWSVKLNSFSYRKGIFRRELYIFHQDPHCSASNEGTCKLPGFERWPNIGRHGCWISESAWIRYHSDATSTPVFHTQDPGSCSSSTLAREIYTLHYAVRRYCCFPLLWMYWIIYPVFVWWIFPQISVISSQSFLPHLGLHSF